MPVSFLTENEREQMQRFPPEISFTDIATFFTLSATDMVLVQKQRGYHNRLGFSLQLCILRYLGFSLSDFTVLPEMLVTFVGKQLGIETSDIKIYGERIATRTEHLQEILAYLGFRKATQADLDTLTSWLVERALEHDRPKLLLQLACEKLYSDKIVRPGLSFLERIVATARSQVQQETFNRLTPLLNPERQTFLDQLLVSSEMTHRTLLSWLVAGTTSNSAPAILTSLKKLAFLREHGIENFELSALNPNRLRFLTQLARKSTNQALQRMPEKRRYVILLAFLYQSFADITDEAIETYDRCLADCLAGARLDVEALRKRHAQAINEKVVLLGELGKFVLDTQIPDVKLRQTIYDTLPEERLQEIVMECQKLARPLRETYFDFLAKRYSCIRQFAPDFLKAFTFGANTEGTPLLGAINQIRELNEEKKHKIPETAPLTFVTDKWEPYVYSENGKISSRYYELSLLWELRTALRAGNVWVKHSRRYADPESYLIPKNRWEALRSEVCRQIKAPESGQEMLQMKKRQLAELLTNADTFFAGKGEVRIENGELVMPRLKEEEIPESAQKLQEMITTRLPRIELSDLLIEVDSWTHFSNCFEHAGGAQPRSPEMLTNLYASIQAQACNFGLSQMANIANLSYEKLTWFTTWYIREETLKLAFTTLVNYQYRQPLSAFWGDGSLASADGQRIPTAGKNRMATTLPRYFGYGRGITLYTWTSDQYSQFGTKPVPTTTRDATYVLDEILGNESDLSISDFTVDTAGETELIFGMFGLLGLGFSPRLRDIGDQQLYRTDKTLRFRNIEPLLHGTINEKLIFNHYDDLLRVAGSLQLGFVTASLYISKLQAHPQKNIITRALQEFGKLEKTIFILRYIQDPVFRRDINSQLNKGEQIHALRQFIHFANEGKMRKHLEEGQINEASCLNVFTNAVIVWNTRYMWEIITQLKAEGYNISDEDIKHLSPARYEHINPYGKYSFKVTEGLNRKELRPLRKP
jgi:TnpA family transposase